MYKLMSVLALMVLAVQVGCQTTRSKPATFQPVYQAKQVHELPKRLPLNDASAKQPAVKRLPEVSPAPQPEIKRLPPVRRQPEKKPRPRRRIAADGPVMLAMN